jgi:hypothetical protein
MRSRLSPLTSFWAPLLVIALWVVVGYGTKDNLFPGSDLLNDFENAHALLAEGQLPEWGAISSFGSANPPGVSYGIVPGILMGGDTPGAANRLAAVFWFSLSVIGIFLYTRKRFGGTAAIVATLIYGLGAPGIFFAISMWPRAHPVFLIWLLYACDRWCIDRHRWSLAQILFISACGSYWMLEILPALLVLPIAYIIYRPPVRWLPVATGFLLALAVWGPYLELQWHRDFRDIHSLLTLRDLGESLKEDPVAELGIEDLSLIRDRPGDWDRYFNVESETSAQSIPNGFWKQDSRFGRVWVLNRESRVEGISGHFFKPENESLWYFQSNETYRIFQKHTGWETSPYPIRIFDGKPPQDPVRFVSNDRWYVTLMGNFNLMISPFIMPVYYWLMTIWCAAFLFARWRFPGFSWRLEGTGLLMLSVLWLYSLYFVFFKNPLAVPSLALFAGVGVLVPFMLALMRWVQRPQLVAVAQRMRACSVSRKSPVLLFLLFYLCPWVLIGLLVWDSGWPSAGRRFLWLYCLQSILFAVLLTDLVKAARISRSVSWMLYLSIVIIVGNNFRMHNEMTRYLRGSFVDEGLSQMEIVGWVARYCADNNLNPVSIGYDIPFNQFELHWHGVDPRYKVGRDFDSQFLYEYGIQNSNDLPEGISPEDDLIIVDKWKPDYLSCRYWDLRNFPRRQIVFSNERWVVLGEIGTGK